MNVVVLMVLASVSVCAPPESAGVSSLRTYTIHAGDTLERIAPLFALDAVDIAALNPQIDWDDPPLGETYSVRVQRLPPVGLTEGLVINVPERALYRVGGGAVLDVIPVAVGRGPTRYPHERWPTPLGTYAIKDKVRNPTWHVPVSIQRELERRGEPVETRVPPGPHNPLGHLAMHTTGPFVIHETPERSSVRRFASHGCVRLLSEDMQQLFDVVELGAPVTVIYEDVKVALTPDAHVLVEINPDRYHLCGEQGARVEAMVRALQPDARIDQALLRAAIKRADGRIADVTDICADNHLAVGSAAMTGEL